MHGDSEHDENGFTLIEILIATRYPANFLELTAVGTAGAPMTMPAGVTPTPILATTLVVNYGTSWTMTMTPGLLGAAPTFVCT